jgi:PAS domain S-box-containing protein
VRNYPVVSEIAQDAWEMERSNGRQSCRSADAPRSPTLPIRTAKTPESKVQLLESLLGAGIWTYDLQSREVTWSGGLFRLIGIDPNAVAASTDLYASLVHPDDRLSHEEIVERARSGELTPRRFRMIRPDGRLIWLESKMDRQFDRDGRMAVLHGVVQDVTAQETLSAELGRMAKVNTSIRKIAGGDFWRANPEGKLLDLTNWARFTGQTTDQLRDYDQLSAVHPDDRRTFRDAWATGISTKERIDLSVRVRRFDGVYQRFMNKIVPVMDADGLVQEWHGMSWLVDDAREDRSATMTLESAHLRAARGLLDWSAQELAAASEVSFSTVRRMEMDASTVKPDSVERVRKTLESRGVRFLLTPDGHVSLALTLAGN